jgi:hypothetical protein
MSLNWENILTIIGALGGWETFKAIINWRINKRKAEAEVKNDEISAKSAEYNLYKVQIEDLQLRLDKRDDKVDFLYREVREKENTILRMTAEANINDLKLTNAEEWRCNILDCQLRHPPKDYKRLNDTHCEPQKTIT